MDGGDGLDSLVGGVGDDVMTAGTGSDRFLKGNLEGNDTITDFLGGADKVDLTTITVDSGLNSTVVTLSDGTTITAANGYLWQASDFI
jgi:Ca2+-binding RTX toxin-like protein